MNDLVAQLDVSTKLEGSIACVMIKRWFMMLLFVIVSLFLFYFFVSFLKN